MSLPSDDIHDGIDVIITANDNDKKRCSEKKGGYVRHKYAFKSHTVESAA